MQGFAHKQLYKQTLRTRRKWIFSIALPIIIQNMVQHFQVLIDRAFLGNLDSRYLAAIGNVIIPYNAVSIFLMFAAMGITILVAQHVGAGRLDAAREVSESSFVYSSIFSALTWLLWFTSADAIFGLLGTSGPIKQDAVTYVRILSVSLIFFGAEITAASTLQGVGHTRPIMFVGMLKNVLNILFDWLLIFGNLGFPEMGLEGAALATLIANAAGSVTLTIFVLRTKRLPFRYRLEEILRPSWIRYKRGLALGLPSGVESLLWFVGQLVLLRMLNGVNPMAVGVLSLVQSVQLLGHFIYQGFARATTTVVGQLWGREDWDEALRGGFQCLRLSILVSIIWAGIIASFPGPLARIFTDDPYVLEQARTIIRMAALFINFQAVNVVVGNAVRGTGDTRWMLFSQIFGTVFVLLVSYVLIVQQGFGLVGMYVTMILDEFIRGMVNLLRFILGRNPFTQGVSGFIGRLKIALGSPEPRGPGSGAAVSAAAGSVSDRDGSGTVLGVGDDMSPEAADGAESEE